MIVTPKIKALFFDREIVKKAVSNGTRKALSKFGAFVRTRARTSMRRKKGPSAPGSPPNAHNGLLKKSIFFSYEPTSQNVVIGPVPVSLAGHAPGEGADALEHGGDTTVVDVDWQAMKARGERKRLYKKRSIHIEARPFMQPAFDYVSKNELPDLWKDSISK